MADARYAYPAYVRREFRADLNRNRLLNRQVHYNRSRNANRTLWLASAAGILVGGYALHYFLPALAFLIAVIAVNVVIEYHKWFTVGFPLDLEVLYAGTVYLATAYGLGWALILVFSGPFIAELSRGRLGREVIIKSAGLLTASLIAATVGASEWLLFIAVCLGLIVQYCGAVLAYHCNAFHNTVRRASTALFAAYTLFFLISF